jgi:hypothetical protein
MNTSEKRQLMYLGRKVRNLRIVAGILLLVVFYAVLGKFDREAQEGQMHLENPAKSQKLASGVSI